MSRRLLLMRHAKSDWNDGSLIDKQRPLNARGQIDAPFMADFLATNSLLPDLILCSSAVRTRQTLELMLESWTKILKTEDSLTLPEVVIEDSLYLASDETILAIATNYPNLAIKQCILILGHNPGMELLASRLSHLSVEMPTAAIAHFDCNEPNHSWPTDWQDNKMWNWRGLLKPKNLRL